MRGQQFFQVPDVIRDARFQGRGNSERLVRPAEVVIGEVKAIGAPQIIPLLAERIR